MIDLSNYNIYKNKDGRLRAYNKTTHKVTSYPRIIMEIALQRPLLQSEDVHHKDKNPCNNDIDNLEIVDHREHERKHAINNNLFCNRKYQDKTMICPVCGTSFTWTVKQQASYNSKTKTTSETRKYDRQPPCCCKSCSGKYAAMIQFGNVDYAGNLKPKEMVCPVCGDTFIWSRTSQWRFKHKLNEIPEPCCSMKCIHTLQRQIKEKKENIS